MAVATVSSVYSQGVVGQRVTSPWLNPEGPFELTQGYGPTAVASEPIEDKQGKRQRWHAGVDIGCPTRTTVVFPSTNSGVVAIAEYLDNPAGYGIALILRIGIYAAPLRGVGPGSITLRKADIYLGHLASRMVKNGQIVREGDHLAFTDSTGNSTGPHLHFEVRPPDGRFGTDVDPSSYFLAGAAAGTGLTNPIPDIGAAITQAEQSVMNTVIGLAQTALGGTMMLAGGATIGFGLRGMSGKQALRVTRGTAGQLVRRRPEFDINRRRQEPTPQVSPAGRTRLRSSLRREVPQPAAPTPSGPPAPLVPRTRGEARGLVPMRYGVPIQGKEAKALRRALPRKMAS